METQTYLSKTLTRDEPSSLNSFPSLENLDGFPQVSPLMADSIPGSSSISPMKDDSLDLQTILEDIIEEETVADPRLSETPSTNDVFSSTSPPSSPSTQYEPSQPLALVPCNSKKPENCQEEGEDDPNSGRPMVCDQFYGRRDNELKPLGSGYSTWTHWWSRPLSPKEASRTEIEPTGVGAGLENLGNTCFINAVLQCFTHTVPFILGLRTLNHHQKPCDRNFDSFCLLCALHDHIELSLNSSGGVVSPSKIFDNLNYISSCFHRYQQEDAHEFLQCLLDRLESCCSNSKLKNNLSTDDCLVKKVFGGRLVSRLSCCNCRHISYTYEPLNDMSLEIEDVDSLPSALESFTKVEKIEDLEATFRCENCKEKVSVEKQLMLDQAPSVATFHLKRFKTQGTFVEKIDKHVVFPLELNLRPYTVVNERSNEELRYQLYAVVKHSGFEPTSGHYICYIRSSPDTWHKLNDSRVTSVEEEVVLSQEAYILLYARQGIPWFSTAIEVHKPCADPVISDSSPKSVLDNIECASDPLVENRLDCGANESKDVADKTLTQFSCKSQFEVDVDEPCVAAEGISGAPANESEFHASKSIDSRDDIPMTDASIPPRSSSCSDEFDKNVSTESHLGKNNRNRGVDEAANDSGFPLLPSGSQCPDKYQRDTSGCGSRAHLKDEKQGMNNRRAVNKPPVMDQGRIEAMRYAKRMPTARGAKLMALLTPQTASKMKKRKGSSPCKRVSPRSRHNHNLMRPVPVSR